MNLATPTLQWEKRELHISLRRAYCAGRNAGPGYQRDLEGPQPENSKPAVRDHRIYGEHRVCGGEVDSGCTGSTGYAGGKSVQDGQGAGYWPGVEAHPGAREGLEVGEEGGHGLVVHLHQGAGQRTSFWRHYQVCRVVLETVPGGARWYQVVLETGQCCTQYY